MASSVAGALRASALMLSSQPGACVRAQHRGMHVGAEQQTLSAACPKGKAHIAEQDTTARMRRTAHLFPFLGASEAFACVRAEERRVLVRCPRPPPAGLQTLLDELGSIRLTQPIHELRSRNRGLVVRATTKKLCLCVGWQIAQEPIGQLVIVPHQDESEHLECVRPVEDGATALLVLVDVLGKKPGMLAPVGARVLMMYHVRVLIQDVDGPTENGDGLRTSLARRRVRDKQV